VTSNALEILDHHFIHGDPQMQKLVEQATVNALVASLIYDARIAAKLTQEQLADLVNVSQSLIARLEDGNYSGDAFSMLHRIARALNCRLNIKLVPDKGQLKSA
jgi:ribosome-binding protein aMBF1 (putative translation factor)